MSMTMTDIATREDWMAFEKELHEKFGLNAAVFNNEGVRITDFVNWGNPLCPVIKGNPKGQQYVCAVAHQNIAGEAARTRKPVVGECDAGLMKIAVPIFVGDEFVGVAGGCGTFLNDSEIESFFVNQTTDIDEDELKKLAQEVKKMEQAEADAIVSHIQKHVDALVQAV